MFAIVEIAGLQYKVEQDQKLFVNRLAGDKGAKVSFDKVLLTSNGTVTVGAPAVEGVAVEAEILDHVQADKVIVFKKKRRKGYKVKNGHRQQLTQILINMLCNHKGLAKTSSKPGKTLLINHFIINNEWYLVDLPGYGYAKSSKTVRNKLEQMIAQYILQRKQLVNVFVLIDIRHEQQKIDREFVDWLGESNVPFSIIFTKADKLSPAKAKSNALLWMKKLQDRWEELPPYFITSAENKTGREEVLNYIEEINKTL